MKKYILFFFAPICWSNIIAQNQLPELNQCLVIKSGDGLEVQYDVSDTDNAQLEIKCKVFSNSTTNKYAEIPIQMITGDIGFPVSIGNNKKLTIRFVDPSILPSDIIVHLTASDREVLNIADILNQVNVQRIDSTLNVLQGKRNVTTDPIFLNKSRDYIKSQSKAFLQTNELAFSTPQYSCINFEATKWGYQNPEQIHIVDAHYDTYNQAPGADDNGSGVVGVLEILRILSTYECKRSIRYLFFDLEEAGLIGSNIYLNNQIGKSDIIKSVINFEMIGYYTDKPNTQDLPAGFNLLFPDAYNEVINNQRRGDFITNVGNTNSNSLIASFKNAAQTHVNSLKVISLEVPGTGTIVPDLRRSDHANFWDKNIPALMITDGANFRNKNYHTSRDSMQYLDLNFMSAVIKASIATLIDLAGAEHATSIDLTYQNPNSNQAPKNESPKIKIFQKVLSIQNIRESNHLNWNIYNTEGHLIKDNHSGNDPVHIDLNHISPGVYYLYINQDGAINTFKFIITP